MSMENDLVRIKEDEGGIVRVRLAGYQHEARALVEAAGGESSFSGYGFEKALIAQHLEAIRAAAQRDRIRAMEDRLPVPADFAMTLKPGDDFDFGPPVGKAPIAGIGKTFTPSEATVHDPRLADFVGRETVFIYNANPPGKVPVIRALREVSPVDAPVAPEVKGASVQLSHSAPARPLDPKDGDRMVVVAGSVAEGDAVLAWGESRPVQGLGRAFILTEDKVQAWQARFPEAIGLQPGVEIQYATLGAPIKDLDMERPGL